MCVYPGAPWGPLGLIISTYVKCLGQLKCCQYLLQSLLYGCTGGTGHDSWEYLEWAPCFTLEYLQKRHSVTVNRYQKHQITSGISPSWKLEGCSGCQKCCPSKSWWYPYTVYKILHGILMRRAGAKLGWWSDIFLIEAQTLIYFYIPYLEYFSKIYSPLFILTPISVCIQSLVYLEQWQKNTIIVRDLRICHIRRKSKISVNLAKQSPDDWLYIHQAGKYLREWKAIYKGLKLFWKDWHKNK